MTVSVLYVDDEPALLEITKLYLERKAALSVETTVSAEEAQTKCKSQRYDVIVSDYLMPGRNGIEFLKALRSFGDETPFILFTGKGREEVAIDALNNGADFYLQKGGDPKAQFAELVHMIRRAAQSRQAKEDLHRSEEKYRMLVQHANSIILRMDPTGAITFINDYAEQFFGFKEDEVLGKNVVGTIVPPWDSTGRNLAEMILDIARDPKQYARNENENVKRNGERVWVAWTNKPLYDEQGTMTGILCIGNDITGRKRADEALRNSEKRLAQIIEFLPDATFAIDSSGKVITWNRAIEEMTGVIATAIVGKGDYEYALPFYGERRPILLDLVLRYESSTANKYTEIRREGEKLIAEKFIPCLRGSGAYLWFTASPLYDTGGRIVGAIETIRDITKTKRAEGALRESEDRYRTFINSSEDMIFLKDAQARYTMINSRLLQFFGKREGDVLGKTDFDLMPRFAAEGCKTSDEAALRTGGVVVSGESMGERLFETRKFPVHLSDGTTGVGGIIKDVTAQRNQERVIRESEQYYRLVVENAHEGILVVQDYRIVSANQSLCTTAGYSASEIVGIAIEDRIHTADREAVLDNPPWRAASAGSVPTYSFRLIRKDGEVRWLCMHGGVPIQWDGRDAVLLFTSDITNRKHAEDAMKESND